MTRYGGLALLLVALGGCAGFEDNVRDLNRSLYRTWSGNDTRIAKPGTAAPS